MFEQLFLLLEILFKLFHELVLTPLLDIIHHRRLPPKNRDEITITINITPAGQRHRVSADCTETDASTSTAKQESRPMKRPAVKKSVAFEEVHVRTYESILGDNPSCSSGPSLAIGWDFNATPPKTIPINTFENQPARLHRPSYFEHDLLVDRIERENTLMKLGYTRAELAAATRQNLKDKKKRRQTADNLNVAYMEEKVEGVKKSLRRNFMFKKGTKAMYKDWKKVVKTHGIDESQHHYLGRRHSDEDATDFNRAQSVLVLGSSGGGSGKKTPPSNLRTLEEDDVLSQSTGEETVEEDMPRSITVESTDNCKISSVRRGQLSFKNKAHRRASM